MPAYSQTMIDEAVSRLVQSEPVQVASLADLEHLAARLEVLGEWVHTMEVIEGGKGTLDFAIMGLDGEEDWEVPMEPSKMRILLDQKIAAMRASGRTFSFDLYFGEAAD